MPKADDIIATEMWDATQCAAHCGDIRPGTWRGWVSRGEAPEPLPTFRPADGRRVWDAATVRAWHGARPGAGARTDIRDKALAEHADPYYLLGRLLGVAAVVQYVADRRPAHERIMEDAGVSPLLLDRLRHECLADTRHTASGSTRKAIAAELVQLLWPAVADLPSGPLSINQQSQTQLGYHHQRGALLAASVEGAPR